MLITFEGKGCRQCPFFRCNEVDTNLLDVSCWLHGQKDCGDLPIYIDFNSLDPEDIVKKKPFGCPFTSVSTVTIDTEEKE